MTAEPKRVRSHPTGLILISLFLFLEGALIGGDVILIIQADRASTAQLVHDLVIIISQGLIALSLIVIGVGLFFRQPLAWTAAMLTESIWLATDLTYVLLGKPSYSTLALGALIVFTLNRRTIRHACGIWFHTPSSSEQQRITAP